MMAMVVSSLLGGRSFGDMSYGLIFGLTKCEDFDQTLSRVRQVGSLREYQKEFERLGNRVQGWTQKALTGTFMGGLKPKIADRI